MAFNADVSLNYATHLPALMRALERSTGPVLELGMGLFSTPYLHYACLLAGRHLVSYESNAVWAERFIAYRGPRHDIRVVADWAPVNLAVHWGVALVDHADERRAPEIEKLAHYAAYIVAHDANGRWDKNYHYTTVYPLFKHRAVWDRDGRHAVVLSNFVDLGDFWN